VKLKKLGIKNHFGSEAQILIYWSLESWTLIWWGSQFVPEAWKLWFFRFWLFLEKARAQILNQGSHRLAMDFTIPNLLNSIMKIFDKTGPAWSLWQDKFGRTNWQSERKEWSSVNWSSPSKGLQPLLQISNMGWVSNYPTVIPARFLGQLQLIRRDH